MYIKDGNVYADLCTLRTDLLPGIGCYGTLVLHEDVLKGETFVSEYVPRYTNTEVKKCFIFIP